MAKEATPAKAAEYPRQWPSDLSAAELEKLKADMAKPVKVDFHGGDQRLARRVLIKVESLVENEANFSDNEIWHTVRIGGGSGAFHFLTQKWTAAPLACVELIKRVVGDVRSRTIDVRPDENTRARLDNWEGERIAIEPVYKYRVQVWEEDSLPFRPWKKKASEREPFKEAVA